MIYITYSSTIKEVGPILDIDGLAWIYHIVHRTYTSKKSGTANGPDNHVHTIQNDVVRVC